MLIRNTNDAYGDSGPFEADSFEALADEMTVSFQLWIDCGDTEQTLEEQRKEFIEGLEDVRLIQARSTIQSMYMEDANAAAVEYTNDSKASVDSAGDVWSRHHWFDREELIAFAHWLRQH